MGYASEIPAEGTNPSLPVYAAFPPAAARGMVVLHELFGRAPEIDRVVERFAGAGYAAVAPDLFVRSSRIACIVQAVSAIRRGIGPQIDDVQRARSWLCERAKLPIDRVGLIGFCLGGGFALAAGRGWAAVSTNYGDIPPTEVMRGMGPVIGCYGAKDLVMGRNGEKLRERLRPLGIDPEIHVFPGVGHAFLTDGDHPLASRLAWPLRVRARDPAVAEDAWERILAFFERRL